jgi:hypothetical protein
MRIHTPITTLELFRAQPNYPEVKKKLSRWAKKKHIPTLFEKDLDHLICGAVQNNPATSARSLLFYLPFKRKLSRTATKQALDLLGKQPQTRKVRTLTKRIRAFQRKLPQPLLQKSDFPTFKTAFLIYLTLFPTGAGASALCLKSSSPFFSPAEYYPIFLKKHLQNDTTPPDLALSLHPPFFCNEYLNTVSGKAVEQHDDSTLRAVISEVFTRKDKATNQAANLFQRALQDKNYPLASAITSFVLPHTLPFRESQQKYLSLYENNDPNMGTLGMLTHHLAPICQALEDGSLSRLSSVENMLKTFGYLKPGSIDSAKKHLATLLAARATSSAPLSLEQRAFDLIRAFSLSNESSIKLTTTLFFHAHAPHFESVIPGLNAIIFSFFQDLLQEPSINPFLVLTHSAELLRGATNLNPQEKDDYIDLILKHLKDYDIPDDHKDRDLILFSKAYFECLAGQGVEAHTTIQRLENISAPLNPQLKKYLEEIKQATQRSKLLYPSLFFGLLALILGGYTYKKEKKNKKPLPSQPKRVVIAGPPPPPPPKPQEQLSAVPTFYSHQPEKGPPKAKGATANQQKTEEIREKNLKKRKKPLHPLQDRRKKEELHHRNCLLKIKCPRQLFLPMSRRQGLGFLLKPKEKKGKIFTQRLLIAS